MKALFISCLLCVNANALFGFGESKTTTGPKISLGREIGIPHTDEDSDTGEIVIPFNDPSTTTTRRRSATTTTPIPILTVGGIGLDRSKTTVDVRSFTSTMNPRFTAATKRLPSSDRSSSSGCPNRIDSYTFGPDYDYAFYESNVYKISNNRIVDRTSLDQEFPDGPKQVNGALYDTEREILWLIAERRIYGYKQGSGEWKLQSVFPKELPSSVGFTPDAAIRWHNKHQVLLSNGGKFALYDEYWNKSLMTGRTDSYFENLPDRVRGISTWNSQGNANVFTQSLVFEYNSEMKKVTGDGVPLGDFWRC